MEIPTRTGGRRARWLAALAIAVATAALPAAAPDAAAFGLDDVVKRAEELARSPFEDSRGRVPKWLLDLSYDQWRDIRFRPERALWQEGKQRFAVQFFHPGLFYERSIGVHVVDGRGV